MLEAIKYEEGHMEILDQLQLPHVTYYQKISNVGDGWEAIKSMKVRGAPAISIVAALSLAVELYHSKFSAKQELHSYVEKQLQFLATSRPTAVNLKQIVQSIIQVSLQLLQDEKVSRDDMKKRLIGGIEKFMESDIKVNRLIGEHGAKHILENCGAGKATVLTHCNTGSLATAGYGTALGVIRYLHEHNNLQHVYCTETRPYNQGARLTAYELVHDKIPATLICDSMVAALMQQGKVSAVVVGADRVVANGDTANKIGTYQIAVCARYHNIPFYVASPRSTFDFSLENGSLIPIEERPHLEMTKINSIPIAAEGIHCWNPAFDVTPGSLITGGIITDCGVFPADCLKHQKPLLSSFNFFEKVKM